MICIRQRLNNFINKHSFLFYMEIENIRNFFVNTQKLSLFERIFKWKKTQNQLIEIYDDLKEIEQETKKIYDIETNLKLSKEKININNQIINDYKIKIEKLEYKITEIEKDYNQKQNELVKTTENLVNTRDKNTDLNLQINNIKEKNENLINENKALDKRINQYEHIKEQREQEHNQKIEKLQTQIDNYENRRKELEEKEKEKETLRFEEMKKTWQKHEINVEKRIKQLCNIHTINYIDKEKYPYTGKPDNCIEIADQLIIFDAKSPSNDNLNNFPTYIKNQTVQLKKYAKQDNVKKDIFLVVPTNTIDLLAQTFYNMSDYNVYVITYDSLEPIMLSLRRIEEYEFAEKLSPEDRDSICRIIGRFAHSTKRRLQIDNYFATDAINILENCNILPDDILEKSIDYEKNTLLNPKNEKRNKRIQLKDLNKSNDKIQRNLQNYNLNTKIEEDDIEKIKLYESSDSNS